VYLPGSDSDEEIEDATFLRQQARKKRMQQRRAGRPEAKGRERPAAKLYGHAAAVAASTRGDATSRFLAHPTANVH
jgi:hypothetical protein